MRRGGQVTEHFASLAVEDDALVIRSDAVSSEVFLRDWSEQAGDTSGDLHVVVTPDRIYLEKGAEFDA